MLGKIRQGSCREAGMKPDGRQEKENDENSFEWKCAVVL